MFSKLLVFAQLLVAALAAPEAAHSSAGAVPYIQNLLQSELVGLDLLEKYDEHYDGMSHADKMREKSQYPEDVYEYLLKHRSSKFGKGK